LQPLLGEPGLGAGEGAEEWTEVTAGAILSCAMIVGILVTEVPASIRAAVEADAQERNLSVNAVVVGVLASRYGVAHDATGYPYTETNGSDDWLVRMSPDLREAVRSHARALIGGSQRGCVLLALSEHYGLTPESPRRRRDPAIDPDIVSAVRKRNEAGESLRSLAREYGVHRETLTRAVRA